MKKVLVVASIRVVNNKLGFIYFLFLLFFLSILLQSQDLRMGQEKKPCIMVNTRELNKVLYTKLAIFIYTIVLLVYSKGLYVVHKANMYIICYMTSF